MTREETRNAVKVMEAYANGKKIQYLNNNNKWIDIHNPSFDWYDYTYRIKPEPKYRPFKSQEECWNEMHKHPNFGWVITKNCKVIYHIDYVYNALFINNCGYSFNEMYQKYEFTDGTPFGIKE